MLGIGDDILPRPSITVEPIKADSKNYYVTVKVQMENNDISTLIKNGFAEYGCEVECSRTFFMQWFGFKTPEFTIILPRHGVAEKVSFDCRVSVIKDIKGYVNCCANKDYDGIDYYMLNAVGTPKTYRNDERLRNPQNVLAKSLYGAGSFKSAK